MLCVGFLCPGRRGLLFVVVCGLLTEALLSLQSTGSGRTGFSSCSTWAHECPLRSCGAQALLLHSMWSLPRPGTESMSPALAGGFFIHPATRSPGIILLSNPIHPSVPSNGPRRALTYKYKSFQPIPLCWFFTIEVFQSKNHSFIASLEYCLGLLMLGQKGTSLMDFLAKRASAAGSAKGSSTLAKGCRPQALTSGEPGRSLYGSQLTT